MSGRWRWALLAAGLWPASCGGKSASTTHDQGSTAAQETSCDDGFINRDETDVDCGGGCVGCAAGASCELGSDCESLICLHDRCQAATCVDAVRNGAELEVDCGGECAPCETCDDGVLDGAETDVDCGGGRCAGCAPEQACDFDEDCESRVCSPRDDSPRRGRCAAV